MRTKIWLCSVAAGGIMLLLLSGCVSSSAPPKGMEALDLVDTVDLERYLGRWYEIARFQSGFEKNVYAATAEYSLREDGRIQVANTGFKNSVDGKYTEVKAVAWVPDPDTPAALKVRFFRLFASDYMIFGLDEESYQWALVGNNSRDFLWFLSREHEISDELYAKMEAIAREQGFDVDRLFKVPQKPRE